MQVAVARFVCVRARIALVVAHRPDGTRHARLGKVPQKERQRAVPEPQDLGHLIAGGHLSRLTGRL